MAKLIKTAINRSARILAGFFVLLFHSLSLGFYLGEPSPLALFLCDQGKEKAKE